MEKRGGGGEGKKTEKRDGKRQEKYDMYVEERKINGGLRPIRKKKKKEKKKPKGRMETNGNMKEHGTL